MYLRDFPLEIVANIVLAAVVIETNTKSPILLQSTVADPGGCRGGHGPPPALYK